MSTVKRYLLLKFSKPELDYLSTIFGLLVTITTVLTVNEVIDKKVGTVIAGIGGSFISILINQPASINPTTEQTEEELVEDNLN